jgi:hypothetical protein
MKQLLNSINAQRLSPKEKQVVKGGAEGIPKWVCGGMRVFYDTKKECRMNCSAPDLCNKFFIFP